MGFQGGDQKITCPKGSVVSLVFYPVPSSVIISTITTVRFINSVTSVRKDELGKGWDGVRMGGRLPIGVFTFPPI